MDLEKICEIYDIERTQLDRMISKFPAFAELNHQRVVDEATAVYGNETKVKQSILKFPAFAVYDHQRVVDEATAVYGNEDQIKKAILKFPRFVSYNHQRVVDEATAVYGNETKVKQSILKYLQFVGLNHQRVLSQKSKVGALIGLSLKETINQLLKNPVNTGHSFKRDIARIDVARELSREGFEINKKIVEMFLKEYITSPYSKGTRLRASKAKKLGLPEPKLLTILRTRLIRQSEK